MSRAPGRHRIGTPTDKVAPRQWDLAQRAAAAQFDQLEPTWHVMYGVASRRFTAMAAWPVKQPLRVEAFTIEELGRLIREAELDTPVPVNRPPRAPCIENGPRLAAVSKIADISATSGRPLGTPPPSKGVSMTHTPPGLRAVCWDLPDSL